MYSICVLCVGYFPCDGHGEKYIYHTPLVLWAWLYDRQDLQPTTDEKMYICLYCFHVRLYQNVSLVRLRLPGYIWLFRRIGGSKDIICAAYQIECKGTRLQCIGTGRVVTTAMHSEGRNVNRYHAITVANQQHHRDVKLCSSFIYRFPVCGTFGLILWCKLNNIEVA